MKKKIFSGLVLIVCVLWLSKTPNSKEKSEKTGPNRNAEVNNVMKQFDYIYAKKLWGNEGLGSGAGSSINYTIECRRILKEVVQVYEINSMVDAPCGAMKWMPLFLDDLSKNANRSQIAAQSKAPFRYHGVDVVSSIIEASQKKYKHKYPEWKFSAIDFSRKDQPLPEGYDLIFSRDALQHLSLVKVVSALEQFSRVKSAKYLLIGSYTSIKEDGNKNIVIGDYFPINLLLPPFSLDKYVNIFDEKDEYGKHLILYKMSYFRTINFEKMYADISPRN